MTKVIAPTTTPALTAEQERIWADTPEPGPPGPGDAVCWCYADGCETNCGNRATTTCRVCQRPICALCAVPLDGRCIDCQVGENREDCYGARDGVFGVSRYELRCHA